MSVYTTCQAIVKGLWPIIGKLEVRGLENVPVAGPFIAVANHQSILDPILIQAVCPRPLHTMAKSTQFDVPGIGWLMARHLHSFPVRRYEVDPQAVRVALRRLAAGHGVGIYLEGERSWDGRLQPLRLGPIRLMLRAGVPIVPVTISGSYDVWPRWARAPRRATIRITFKESIPVQSICDRTERERELSRLRPILEQAITPET